MTTHKKPLSIRHTDAGRIAVAGLLIMLIAGCAGNYGSFSKNVQVGNDFYSGNFQSDYHYYYSGRDNMPYAIIGIDQDYTVPSKYWIRFDPEPEKLKKMAGNMYGKHQYNPYGYHILDPEGTIIGIWFSSVRQPSVGVDPENLTVEVLFRNPENTRSMSVGMNYY
jgi:hypothetical protein